MVNVLKCPKCRDTVPERRYWPCAVTVSLKIITGDSMQREKHSKHSEYILGFGEMSRADAEELAEKLIRQLIRERGEQGKNGFLAIRKFDRQLVKPCLCTKYLREGNPTTPESRKVLQCIL